jgi:hypothetical protein
MVFHAIDHVEKDQPTTQIKTIPFLGTSKGRCSFRCYGRLSEVHAMMGSDRIEL